MPEDIDERWEYWEPDPEVRELLGEDEYLVNLLPDRDYQGVQGFRVGDPNYDTNHLAPEPAMKTPRERRPRTPNRQCPGCDRAFWTGDHRQSFCTRRCYLKARREERPPPPTAVCEWCLKEYRPNPSNRGRFCSRDCFLDSVGAVSFGRGKTCVGCGGKFIPPRGHPAKKYCTHLCFLLKGATAIMPGGGKARAPILGEVSDEEWLGLRESRVEHYTTRAAVGLPLFPRGGHDDCAGDRGEAESVPGHEPVRGADSAAAGDQGGSGGAVPAQGGV